MRNEADFDGRGCDSIVGRPPLHPIPTKSSTNPQFVYVCMEYNAFNMTKATHRRTRGLAFLSPAARRSVKLHHPRYWTRGSRGEGLFLSSTEY